MTTLENAFRVGKCARTIHELPGMECSLRRVAGNEPEREQKGTYTHSTFHKRKSGIAYTSRDAWRRNPHTTRQKGKDDPTWEGAAHEDGEDAPC